MFGDGFGINLSDDELNTILLVRARHGVSCSSHPFFWVTQGAFDVRRRQRVKHDIAAGLREHLRDGLADAVARMGDENHLARDIEFGRHQMGNLLAGNDGLASGPASSSMSRRGSRSWAGRLLASEGSRFQTFPDSNWRMPPDRLYCGLSTPPRRVRGVPRALLPPLHVVAFGCFMLKQAAYALLLARPTMVMTCRVTMHILA